MYALIRYGVSPWSTAKPQPEPTRDRRQAARRRGPGLGPGWPGRCRAPGPRTRPRLGVDQPARL